MKKLPIIMLSLLTLPVHAQSILSTLNSHQSSLKPAQENNSQSSTNSSSTPEVKPSSESVSSTSLKCEEDDQTSLPLAYITSLIQEKDAHLDIRHIGSENRLEILSAPMISNCNSMIEWKLKKPEIQGKKAYALEAVIKKGDVCNVDGTCSYKVKMVNNGDFKEHLNMNFKPTLKGFEECLQKSGVIKDGKVNSSAIASEPLNEKFTGLDYSGKLLFLSHGPSSSLVKAKYGKFEHQNGCDYYENSSAQPTTLLTSADANKARLDAEAAQLRDCKADEYNKLSVFIAKYQEYADELGVIRDRLILEAVKKSAENIGKGKYTEEDLKVLKDFNEKIVAPLKDKAVELYEASLDLDGDAKKAVQDELVAVLAQLSSLQKAPYLTEAHHNKLVADGRFEDAGHLKNALVVIQSYQRLGTQENGVKITSGTALQKAKTLLTEYNKAMETEKKRYMVRTGQELSKDLVQYNSDVASARWRIQERNKNYTAKIQEIYADIVPPNGHCFKYWVNTQKCTADTQADLNAQVAKLQFDNDFDQKIIAAGEAGAKEWSDLEAQGRRYIAAQNGVEVPADAPATAATDTTQPPERQNPQTAAPNFYNFQPQSPGQQPGQQQYFNYQGAMQSYQQYNQQTMPNYGQNVFQQPQNPYGQQQQYGQQNYYQPYMGQQAYGYQPQQYGYQAQMNFGFGNQAAMYQQQNPYAQYGMQSGYQQSPYGYQPQQQQGAASWYRPYGTAYNQYSLYGQ